MRIYRCPHSGSRAIAVLRGAVYRLRNARTYSGRCAPARSVMVLHVTVHQSWTFSVSCNSSRLRASSPPS